MVRIAWYDFLTLKISNFEVIILTLIALVASVLGGTSLVLPHVLAGLLLFFIGFSFWLLGGLGGGDAKLFFPIGVLIGWHGLAGFAVILLLASFLSALVVRYSHSLKGDGPLVRRLQEIQASGKFPFGVPMGLAGVLNASF
nr:prepilin peptidase [Aliiroseovarius subalbicans]